MKQMSIETMWRIMIFNYELANGHDCEDAAAIAHEVSLEIYNDTMAVSMADGVYYQHIAKDGKIIMADEIPSLLMETK